MLLYTNRHTGLHSGILQYRTKLSHLKMMRKVFSSSLYLLLDFSFFQKSNNKIRSEGLESINWSQTQGCRKYIYIPLTTIHNNSSTFLPLKSNFFRHFEMHYFHRAKNKRRKRQTKLPVLQSKLCTMCISYTCSISFSCTLFNDPIGNWDRSK
jgi:hypothetical protein